MFKLAVLLSIAAVCGATSYKAASYQAGSYENSAPLYKFAWGVKDADSYNDFGHEESRDGDRTDGYYHVALPDGRIQRVTYSVDQDSGFVAQVAYEGEARYDAPTYKTKSYSAPVYSAAPSYAAPAPVVYKAAPAPVVYKAAPAPSYGKQRSSYGGGRRVHVTHASPGAGGSSEE